MSLFVYWTRFAEKELDNIFSYYEEKTSLSRAKKLVNKIIDKTISIENTPFIGQKELTLKNYKEDFRYLVYKSYKIIYFVNSKKNRIEISDIFDTRQNPIKIKRSNS